MSTQLASARNPADGEAAVLSDDPLLSFQAETEIAAGPSATPAPGPLPRRPMLVALATLGGVALIAAGEHRVTISTDHSTIQRQVTVASGATATVMATIAAAGGAAGWAQIKAPVEMQIFEGGQLIATTSASRFMLPAGRHELEVANTDLEF